MNLIKKCVLPIAASILVLAIVACNQATEKPEGAVAEKKTVEKKTVEKKTVEKKTDAKAEKAKAGTTGDWTMWGGNSSRNMVNDSTGLKFEFDPEKGSEDPNILWTAKLGSQTYANPVVANGKVLVGTNNAAEYRKNHVGDRGVLLCFNEADGKFLWQLTREKLPEGRVHDWPEQGICSTPCVDGDKVYLLTNRCELICVDLDGMHDGNDGITDEADQADDKGDADIIWNLDMIEELGVFPHNLATSSPFVYEDMVYLVTGNGVDEAHLEIPAPRAPCFLAVNKNTGEVVWEDNTPFDEILHGQWSSPCFGVVNGKPQVIMPGGDGWIYSLNPKDGTLIWKFDLNPKESAWELGGRGDRNAIIGTPVFHDNSVIIGVGQDPEHGNGVGHLYRIDATKEGDVSAELGEKLSKGKPNPNSAQIWQYGGVDADGSVTGKEDREIFRRTMSTVSIHDGLVYASDLTGFLHCVDFKTGKRKWEFDTFGEIWGSPLYVDGRVLLGSGEGTLFIFPAGPEEPKSPESIEFPISVYSTPTIANGVMYITDRSTLYAIKVTE